MNGKTHLPAVVAGMAMAALIVDAAWADKKTRGDDKFAWGQPKSERKTDIKIGVRVEKAKGAHPDLFVFTTVVQNCTDQTVKIAAGDTWDGPMRPEYVIGDEKRNEWRIAPPHVLQTGRGITRVRRPLILTLKPHETRVVHRGTFVPPVPAGTWTVRARLRPSAGLGRGARQKRPEVVGVWTGGTLISGRVSLTMEKGASQSPRQDASANSRKPRR